MNSQSGTIQQLETKLASEPESEHATETEIPRIVITMGDSAGIGPELIVRIARLTFSAQLVVLGDSRLLLAIAQRLQLPLEISPIDWNEPVAAHVSGHLYVEEHQNREPVVAGQLSTVNARTTLSILERASELALSGMVRAIVTAPVHKANLNSVAPDFLGHTEFFAEKANVDKVVMMLASGDLRITLATTHLPLSEVPASITQQSLSQVLNVIISSFERLQIGDVRIAVCGLNPHAGENGLLGKEDDSVIRPVIEHFQQRGKSVSGPFPADTLFTPQKRQLFDVFLAMYHDQGLPVVKAFGFGQCANITLGLPYIRTSVDHGTALDIAGKYCASGDSLEYAINYAIQLVAGNLPK